MRHVRWEIEELGRRKWRWEAQVNGEIAKGEASSEGTAYIAADAALDAFLERERKEAIG